MTTQAISQWNLDPTHSEVQFKVRHLVISNVTGTFRNFSATLEKAGDDFNGAKVSFTAHVDSIDTNQTDRDNHLKSPEFFDAAQFPTIEFVSSSFEKSGDNTYSVKGHLTMKGITREVELSAELGGELVDPWGNRKLGFEVSGTVKREDFGLTWSAVTEAGGVVVGSDVKLLFNVQFAAA
jgi:polyisoprenoid-binding protein YceI